MASKDRERQLARAKFERQQARRAERARRRRRNNILAAVVGVVVVALVGVVVYALNRGSDTTTVPAAAGSPTPSAGAASCTFAPGGTPAKGGSALGRPADGPAANEPGYTATLSTNVGTIAFTALTDKAPCATRSFAYLAGKKYFDGTPCHRLTTTGIYVLQCGDPSGTGSGGPGYSFGDENLPAAASGGTAVYKAGTVAMANSGPSTNGSQFFLVYKDSPLPPNYTVFGTITQGLDVVSKVAAAGVAGGGGDGAPQDKVTIKTVTISK